MSQIKFKLYPSSVDPRDFVYFNQKFSRQESVDLREWDSPVESQYQLGSCVGNALANAYEHMVRRTSPEKFVDLSRLFIYYNARAFVNEQSVDIGATVRNGLKGLKLYGVCAETLWPYVIENFDDRPSNQAYKDAATRKIKSYTHLYTNNNVIESLSLGNPVVFGLDLFDRFMDLNKENAVVTFPTTNEQSAGAHAMCLVGYDLKTKLFLAKNSFGTDWGYDGYCWIPFDYFQTYSFDKWTFKI